MLNTLMYPCFNTEALVGTFLNGPIVSCGNPTFAWLLNGRLPETRTVTPNNTTQVVIPTAKNKYLESVTVNPVDTTPLTVTPSTEVQTFSAGYYSPVVVEATT